MKFRVGVDVRSRVNCRIRCDIRHKCDDNLQKVVYQGPSHLTRERYYFFCGD